MKQFLLFTLFLSLFALNVQAQDFELNPEMPVYNEEGLDLSDINLEVVNHATFTNTSSSELSLVWKRTVISAPTPWRFPVCDNNQCYFYQVDIPDEAWNIAPGAESILDVHCQPRGAAGCGTVQLELAPFDDQDNILATYIYEFRVNDPECVISSVDAVTVSKVKVYPNPTTDIFKIAELENIPAADRVEVYNVLGKKVKTFSAAVNTFDVSNLPDGMYLVSLMSETDGVIKTIRMSKSVMRP